MDDRGGRDLGNLVPSPEYGNDVTHLHDRGREQSVTVYCERVNDGNRLRGRDKPAYECDFAILECCKFNIYECVRIAEVPDGAGTVDSEERGRPLTAVVLTNTTQLRRM